MTLSASIRCEACGSAEEFDGTELTDDAREAFYRAEGCWSLSLRDLGPRRLEVLQVLRRATEHTLPAIAAMVASGEPIRVGALVEVEQLHAALLAAGASVALVRVT